MSIILKSQIIEVDLTCYPLSAVQQVQLLLGSEVLGLTAVKDSTAYIQIRLPSHLTVNGIWNRINEESIRARLEEQFRPLREMIYQKALAVH